MELAAKQVLERLHTIERELSELKRSVRITHGQAKRMITQLIATYKAEGKEEIGVLDIRTETHLPVVQISDILAELEREGVVHA